MSDVDPFIEALFRTLEHRVDHPTSRFQTLEEAVAAIEAFVRWYNHGHLWLVVAVLLATRYRGRATEPQSAAA